MARIVKQTGLKPTIAEIVTPDPALDRTGRHAARRWDT
jgi:hypothetical protein